MTDRKIVLEQLPGPLKDLDFTPSGNWVAFVGQDASSKLILNGKQVPLPRPIRCPLVRAVSDDIAIVVDMREGQRRSNAFILSTTGMLGQFFAGDAVQDVFATNDAFVFTYFDEGIGGMHSWEGIAIFDHNGTFRYGFNSGVASRRFDISDCYSACRVGADALAFFAYTEFQFAILDLGSRKCEAWETPSLLHGAHAISVKYQNVYFYSPYGARGKILAWTIGASEAHPVAEYTGLLRGLPGGKFLAIDPTGYNLLENLD